MESEGSSSQVAIWRRGVGPWLVRILLIYILKVRLFCIFSFYNWSQFTRSIWTTQWNQMWGRWCIVIWQSQFLLRKLFLKGNLVNSNGRKEEKWQRKSFLIGTLSFEEKLIANILLARIAISSQAECLLVILLKHAMFLVWMIIMMMIIIIMTIIIIIIIIIIIMIMIIERWG